MKKIYREFHSGQKGFTLIELLVVIAILGVLAAIIVPNVTRFINSGNEAAAGISLHDVQVAVTSAMAASNVPYVGGAAPIPAPVQISSAHDLDVVTGALVTPANPPPTNDVGAYLNGGIGKLTTTYTVSGDGSVTSP